MRSLLHQEARARADLLRIDHYDLNLDLRGAEDFESRVAIRFSSGEGGTFLDLQPLELHAIRLDGAGLDPADLQDGRYPLRLAAGEHLLEVRARMRYRNDGEGLHRAVDPVDGRVYLYEMNFMSAAGSVYACFDQPDLKARYTVNVVAPPEWIVAANGAVAEAADGAWRFATTEPLSTYFVTLVAGPYHRLEDVHDGIPLGLLSRRSLAGALDQDADELFTLTRQCFDDFHARFGVRYPFGKYDQAFVPEFNAGAMENPGCVTFRDPLLFTSRVPRTQRLQRATTIAHEMAHQWFGNLVTPRWWDDLWLNEAFAEYMGNRVTAEATAFDDALLWAEITRKNWGLSSDSWPSTHPVAGTGAVDADSALQDFDGISYSKGHAVLTQLAAQVGDEVFFAGVRDHFERHRFGNATMADLFGSWERAGAVDLGGQDLAEWTRAWLRSAGVDRLAYERDSGSVVCTGPGNRTSPRRHALRVGLWDGTGWDRHAITVGDGATTLTVPAGTPVLLDADGSAWADLAFDAVTAEALPALLPATTDPEVRASIWTTLRNAVQQARIAPSRAVGVIAAGLPSEDLDPTVSTMAVWLSAEGEGTGGTIHDKLLPVVPDLGAARALLRSAFTARLDDAVPGSDLQLAALYGVLAVEDRVTALRRILDGAVPEGITVDSGLRWRVLRRLADLESVDRAELDAELERDRDTKNQLAHAWCRARLPDPEAKDWAWRHFTGEIDASNYQLEAVGTGMWAAHQRELLAGFAAEYFEALPATAAARAGWVLADAARLFYPMPLATGAEAERSVELAEDPGLNPTLRRVLIDAAEQVRRREAARALG